MGEGDTVEINGRSYEFSALASNGKDVYVIDRVEPDGDGRGKVVRLPDDQRGR